MDAAGGLAKDLVPDAPRRGWLIDRLTITSRQIRCFTSRRRPTPSGRPFPAWYAPRRCKVGGEQKLPAGGRGHVGEGHHDQHSMSAACGDPEHGIRAVPERVEQNLGL